MRPRLARHVFPANGDVSRVSEGCQLPCGAHASRTCQKARNGKYLLIRLLHQLDAPSGSSANCFQPSPPVSTRNTECNTPLSSLVHEFPSL